MFNIIGFFFEHCSLSVRYVAGRCEHCSWGVLPIADTYPQPNHGRCVTTQVLTKLNDCEYCAKPDCPLGKNCLIFGRKLSLSSFSQKTGSWFPVPFMYNATLNGLMTSNVWLVLLSIHLWPENFYDVDCFWIQSLFLDGWHSWSGLIVVPITGFST